MKVLSATVAIGLVRRSMSGAEVRAGITRMRVRAMVDEWEAQKRDRDRLNRFLTAAAVVALPFMFHALWKAFVTPVAGDTPSSVPTGLR